MSDLRFSGMVDHLAVRSNDLAKDVEEYKRMGFSVESQYEDWAMMRDPRGFGIALLPSGSHHPPHIGLKVDSMEELQAAAEKEGREIKEHRDRSVSFYTKGVGGNPIELVYYPEDFGKE